MPTPKAPSRHAKREAALLRGKTPAHGAGLVPPTPSARERRRVAPRCVREAWVSWLAPHFASDGAAYFTGTYSDEYGFANGCTHTRNVMKDWARFLKSIGYDGKYIIGVEKHLYRDVLHFHAILAGPFDDNRRAWLKASWAAERGHARVLPVHDGCASYVTKYALKGDTDSFEWSLR